MSGGWSTYTTLLPETPSLERRAALGDADAASQLERQTTEYEAALRRWEDVERVELAAYRSRLSGVRTRMAAASEAVADLFDAVEQLNGSIAAFQDRTGREKPRRPDDMVARRAQHPSAAGVTLNKLDPLGALAAVVGQPEVFGGSILSDDLAAARQRFVLEHPEVAR